MMIVKQQSKSAVKRPHTPADARAQGGPSPVVALLLTAAELHVRADLGVVDAAERTLSPDVLVALRSSAADMGTAVRESASG